MKFGLVLGLILGITVTFFLFLIVVSGIDANHPLVSSSVIAFLKDVVGPFAAGLGGAAVGALLSSHFQHAHDKAKENDQILKDYFHGYSILLSKFHELRATHENAVRPYQEYPLRFVDIPSAPGYSNIQERAELILGPILLQLGLFEVMDTIRTCETGYSYCLQNHAQRDNIFNECRDKLIDIPDEDRDILRIVEEIGLVKVGRLYFATEGFIEVLDETLEWFAKLLNILDTQAAPQIKKLNPLKIVAASYSALPIQKTPPPAIRSTEHLEEIYRDCLAMKQR